MTDRACYHCGGDVVAGEATTGEPPFLAHDACAKSYAGHVSSNAKACNCCSCCQDHPCASVLAGGVCDGMPCFVDLAEDLYESERWDGYEEDWDG